MHNITPSTLSEMLILLRALKGMDPDAGISLKIIDNSETALKFNAEINRTELCFQQFPDIKFFMQGKPDYDFRKNDRVDFIFAEYLLINYKQFWIFPGTLIISSREIQTETKKT